MVFRQCTIGGKAYYGDPKPTHYDREQSGHKRSASSDSTYTQARDRKSLHTPPPDSLDEDNTFRDALLSQDIEAALGGDPHSSEPYDAAHARSINGFFSVLALCHTVVAGVDPLTGNIRYKSQSPDEAALVQAAADCGFVFLANDRGVLSMRTPGSGYQHIGPGHDRDLSAPAPAGDSFDEDGIEKYELLNILEFSSARKRMSVIVRKLSGGDRRIFLMCKGADNVIFERLKGVQPGGRDEETMKRTEGHLSEFANNGLRTLTLAYKVISGGYRFSSFASLLITELIGLLFFFFGRGRVQRVE
jgi:phospholipid-translocating ATPase